jgi:hypothetical protein
LLNDIIIEFAKGFIMLTLQGPLSPVDESQLKGLIGDAGTQAIVRIAAFSTTLLQVCLSVYEDLDESVIALASGDYFVQIGKIYDGIGRQKQANPYKLNV